MKTSIKDQAQEFYENLKEQNPNLEPKKLKRIISAMWRLSTIDCQLKEKQDVKKI